MKKVKGSITIFAALSIMMVAAFLFALLEAARMAEVKKIAQMNTDSVLESVFAGYQIPLWENYRMLLFDGEGGKNFLADKEMYIRTLSNENLKPIALGADTTGTNLLQMEASEVCFEKYLLITDQGGEAFAAAAASYMRNSLSLEVAKRIYGSFDSLKALEESESTKEDSIGQAMETIESSQKNEPEEKADTKETIEVKDDPLKAVAKVQKSGLLSLVISDIGEISDAKIDLSDAVSHRSLRKGVNDSAIQTTWMDSVLLEQYLITYFSNYTNCMKSRALQYEVEYLICGNSDDAANLKGTITRLLGIREAANLLYLMTDAEKQEEALAVATALAGVSLNPAVIEVVKLGVLAAWAFAESILDIRALLQGEKIALIKNAGQWTSDILHLSSVFTSSGKAKSCSNGLNYTSYLGILLFFQDTGTLSYRAMDMQEASIRKMEGYQDFYMDSMVLEAEIKMTYRYHSIFLGMDSITGKGSGYFQIPGYSAYSYRKAGA